MEISINTYDENQPSDNLNCYMFLTFGGATHKAVFQHSVERADGELKLDYQASDAIFDLVETDESLKDVLQVLRDYARCIY